MEKQLSFELKLSLQEMALRRVVINLWNENDILTSIVNFRINALPGNDFADIMQYIEERGTLDKELQQIVEDEVKNKVVKLALPELLKKQLMRIIKPVGSQMLKWKMSFHNERTIDSPEDFDIDILKQLHWTSVGVVDYQKTAENLVRHEMLDTKKRYKLACLYSLVDYIPDLWKELPEESKAFFDSDVVVWPNLELQLSSYWAYIVTAKESKLCNIFAKRYGEGMSFHQYAFRCAAREGNRATTEYFFRKLTREERDVHFLRTVRKIIRKGRRYLNKEFLDFAMEKLSDVLSYLLSLMSNDEKMQVLKDHPCEVLACFLDWPWHDLCLDIADLIWTFLPKILYAPLIENIRVSITYSGYYFPELLQKFFVSSPIDFKVQFVTYEIQSGSLFKHFFDAEDAESIVIVFRNLDVKERGILISCPRFFYHFYSLVMADKWHLIKACIRAGAPSKENKDKLKKIYMVFLSRFYSRDMPESRKHQWEMFFELLDADANALSEKKVNTDQRAEE